MSLAILVGTLAPAGMTPVALATGPTVHDIATCADLNALGADSATAADTINLTANLDCTGVDFIPMYPANFEGTFDGHGYRIAHLTINHPSDPNQALFASTDHATIKNLILDSGVVNGDYFVAGLVATAYSTSIDNVVSHLDINSVYYTGGLVGAFSNSDPAVTAAVTNSSTTGDIAVTDGYGGGLIGYTQCQESDCVIHLDFATGNVTGPGGYMGGLVGDIYQTTSSHAGSTIVTDAYATGNVSSPSWGGVGGLIGEVYNHGSNGYNSTVTIARTYATGAVTGDSYVGGLLSEIDPAFNVQTIDNLTDNFATGAVTSNDPTTTAGLVGGNYFASPYTVASSGNYFDQTGTGLSDCTTQNTLDDCTGKTDSNWFKGNHTNGPMSAWNFTTTWATTADGYPTFVNLDRDGSSTAVEDAAPGSGDANSDGIPDSRQGNVASFVDPASGHYASLALPEACAASEVSAAAESANATADAGYDYPAGLVNFTAHCGTNGFTATVQQYFYGLSASAASLVARKYDATTHSYTIIPGATITAVTIGGQSAIKVTYDITDGGLLDQDGTVNGAIVDPAGPAALSVGVPNTGLGALSQR